MATNTNDILQIRYSDPITLYVYSGIDNFGNTNFGGYNIYVVKVPTGEVPLLNSSGITIGRRMEHVRTIYPEVDVSYSGRTNRIGEDPIQRLSYNPQYIYPVDYYVSEENFDHYFYLSAFDKKGNLSSGLIPHINNPLRGPSIQSRAIQFANPNSTIVIYNSGVLYPNTTASCYPSGTVSFWVTTPNSGNTAPTYDYGIVEKVNSNRVPSPFAIHVESTFPGYPFLRCHVGVGGSASTGVGTNQQFWESSTLEFNKKYHIVFTWSGVTASTISGTIYLNGIKDVGSVKTMSFGMPAGPTGGSNIYLGTVASALESWSGLILDGLHVYNRAFSDSDVRSLYSGQIHGIPWSYDSNSLLTKFSFDEGSGIITYADYPVISPEISGVFSGDIRWVRPLYIELRTDSFNSNVQQFFNTYVTSGQINSGVITPTNVSFQNRLFTNSGVRGEVESLNNAGIVADNKVVQNSILDGAVSNTKFTDPLIVNIDGNKFTDRNGNTLLVEGNNSIVPATVGNTLFENQNILYLQDDNTIKKVDGTTKKLNYTTLSGVQEYRHIWSSHVTKTNGVGLTSEVFVTTVTGIIAEAPFRIQSKDTLVYVTGYVKTGIVWVESCDDTCNAPQLIGGSTSTSWTAISGVANFTSLTTGPGAIQLLLGPNGSTTASGYLFSIEIGDHA